MKYLIVLIILLAATAGSADAYQNDTVFIQGMPKDNNSGSIGLAQTVSAKLQKQLLKAFPCLYVNTNDDIRAVTGFLRTQQLFGTVSDEVMVETTNNLGKHSDAKYLISISTSFNPVVGYRLFAVAWARTQKGPAPFFEEGDLYGSYEAALDAATPLVEQLVKAFVEKASKYYWFNEVCPYKGRVDVTVVTRRKQHNEDTFYSYCNGEDQKGKKSETITAEGKQLWKFKRIGNPDTWGTLEYTMTETYVKEDVDGCHICKSGRKGPWNYKDEVQSNSVATGLDTSTYIKGVSDNKDATINLRFEKNGTYTIVIKAASAEGKKQTTHSTTAEGTCDLVDKRTSQTTTFTEPLEARFEDLTGTVFDKKLSGNKKIVLPTKQNGEENEISIDFELERP